MINKRDAAALCHVLRAKINFMFKFSGVQIINKYVPHIYNRTVKVNWSTLINVLKRKIRRENPMEVYYVLRCQMIIIDNRSDLSTFYGQCFFFLDSFVTLDNVCAVFSIVSY